MASKWEDTVMKDKQIAKLCVEHIGWDEPVSERDIELIKPLFESQAEITWHARDKEEITFLDEILHLPFFEFCLRVKERKQMLIKDLASPAKRMGN